MRYEPGEIRSRDDWIETVCKWFSVVGGAVLLILILTGCTWSDPFVRPPHLTSVILEVRWHDTLESVAAACRNRRAAGCATVGVANQTISWQHLLRPRAWDDQERICGAGHELMHSLGATH